MRHILERFNFLHVPWYRIHAFCFVLLLPAGDRLDLMRVHATVHKLKHDFFDLPTCAHLKVMLLSYITLYYCRMCVDSVWIRGYTMCSECHHLSWWRFTHFRDVHKLSQHSVDNTGKTPTSFVFV